MSALPYVKITYHTSSFVLVRVHTMDVHICVCVQLSVCTAHVHVIHTYCLLFSLYLSSSPPPPFSLVHSYMDLAHVCTPFSTCHSSQVHDNVYTHEHSHSMYTFPTQIAPVPTLSECSLTPLTVAFPVPSPTPRTRV